MALLEVEGLTKAFGGLRAISDLSFQVNEGEILGLIGPNGAGKTTAFSLIAGFIRPNSGKVVLEGKDIVGLKPYAITRKGIARTFQIVKPFRKLTVLENVTLAAFLRCAARRQAEHEAYAVLERVGLETKAFAFASQLGKFACETDPWLQNPRSSSSTSPWVASTRQRWSTHLNW